MNYLLTPERSTNFTQVVSKKVNIAYLRKFGYLRNVILVFHCGLVHTVYPVSANQGIRS